MLKIYRLNKRQNTFEVTLKYKGVKVNVSFVDGNTYNGTPAKCYTNDAFKQRAIEASQMFKDREITIERAVPDEQDRKAEAERKAKMAQIMARKKAAQPTKTVKTEQKPEPSPEPTPEPVTNPDPDPEPEKVKEDGDSSIKVFDSLNEAILFVAQNYQEQVTDEKEVRELLKAHGINPRIKKG